MKPSRTPLIPCAALFAVALATPKATNAEIQYTDFYRSDFYLQSADGPALTLQGSSAALRLYAPDDAAYTTVDATFAGPASPITLAPLPGAPAIFAFTSPTYPTRADAETAFPIGDYAFSATGPSLTDATTLTVSPDDFPLTLPYLTGASYSSLQNADPTAPIPLTFSSYAPGLTTDESFIFFTLFDTATNTFVFNADFLPSTTSGLTVPANALLPGHDYIYELIFSNRTVTPTPNTTFNSQLGFDLRTQGAFTTAIPEPTTALLTPFLAFALRRRRH